MPSSRARARAAALGALALVLGHASRAGAQDAHGFGVERLRLAAAGAGWVVMDALDMRGGLGGAASLTATYAHHPLRVTSADGAQRLVVIDRQAFADFGFAVTYERLRLSLALDAPLLASGSSGTVDGQRFTAPAIDPGSHPDTLTDARLGFEGRFLGDAASPVRVGASAQLFFPSGAPADYLTDGTYRATGRLLVAGDLGAFTYAGHVGAHVRPLDDASTPEGPRGSELLFGAAAGARLALGAAALVVGPELHGATAFRSLLTAPGTALEGLLTGRLAAADADAEGLHPGAKVAAGAGFNARLGAPEWRLVLGLELVGRFAALPR
jgi:hypothetical protein